MMGADNHEAIFEQNSLTATQIEHRIYKFKNSPQMEALINNNNMAAYEAMNRYNEQLERILVDRICVLLCSQMGRIESPVNEVMPLYK